MWAKLEADMDKWNVSVYDTQKLLKDLGKDKLLEVGLRNTYDYIFLSFWLKTCKYTLRGQCTKKQISINCAFCGNEFSRSLNISNVEISYLHHGKRL